jgi:small conductance mechanosensitive channel
MAHVSRRWRTVFALLSFCWLLAAGPAAAQPAATASTPAAGQAAPADVERLIKTLQDPAARTQLISDLQTLLATQKVTPAPAESPLGDEPGQQVLQALSDALVQASGLLDAAMQGLGNPQHIVGWFERKIADPGQRAAWVEALFKLGIVLGGGMLAGALAGWLAAGPARRLAASQPTPGWRLLPPLFRSSLLDLVPTLVFAVVAYGAMVAAAPGEPVRLAASAIVAAALVVRLLLAVARFLLSPFAPALRLFSMQDETAAYLDVWLRRLAPIVVYGFFALEVGRALGLPRSGYAAFADVFGLLLALLLIVFVLQNREIVARLIRGRPAEADEVPDPLRRLRRQLGNYWHILAVLYLAALYVVWALHVRHGFTDVLRGTAMTALILLIAGLLIRLGRRAWDRMLAVNRELLARYPLIEHRANRYLPYIKRGLILTVQIGAGFAVLAAWHVDVDQMLQGVGRELLGRFAGLAVVLAIALILWEAANLAITMYLERRDRNGTLLVRSARMRTLLPLVRNVVLVVIVLFAGLSALSTLGIDITPFLAGAGVAGIAIGFGAQTLVKDVITGAFILFEGTVSIGDGATINGLTGQVEHMTIRTIRLRDGSGILHTIPFGAITTVSNLTRDFAYWQTDVAVAYKENTDAVIAVLREAFESLRGDATVASSIIGGLEVDGIGRFEANAVYIGIRIKTWPGQQGLVGHAYNRLIKLAFDQHGIAMPFPQQTIWLGQGPDGSAPLVRVHSETAESPVPARKSRSA